MVVEYDLNLESVSKETKQTLLFELGLQSNFKAVAYWIHEHLVKFNTKSFRNKHLDTIYNGDTLLHLAASKDHYGFVVYLVKQLAGNNSVLKELSKVVKELYKAQHTQVFCYSVKINL